MCLKRSALNGRNVCLNPALATTCPLFTVPPLTLVPWPELCWALNLPCEHNRSARTTWIFVVENIRHHRRLLNVMRCTHLPRWNVIYTGSPIALRSLDNYQKWQSCGFEYLLGGVPLCCNTAHNTKCANDLYIYKHIYISFFKGAGTEVYTQMPYAYAGQEHMYC